MLPESSKRCHISLWLTIQGKSVPVGTRFLGRFVSVRTQKCRSDPSVEEASPEADKTFEVINTCSNLSKATEGHLMNGAELDTSDPK